MITDPKLINFLLALATGKVWGGVADKGRGYNQNRLWDYPEGLKFVFEVLSGKELFLDRIIE